MYYSEGKWHIFLVESNFFILPFGKECAGILHEEELMINQIFCVEFVFIITQAGALQTTGFWIVVYYWLLNQSDQRNIAKSSLRHISHTAHYLKGLSGAPALVSDSDQTEPETGSDTDMLTDTSNQHHIKSTTQQKQAEVEEEIKVTAVVAQLVKNKKQKGTIRTSKSSNKIIRVLLDSGSDGDLWFHQKGTPRPVAKDQIGVSTKKRGPERVVP